MDIVINNQDNKTLNGNYSIARFVAVSQQVRLPQSLYIQRSKFVRWG